MTGSSFFSFKKIISQIGEKSMNINKAMQIN